MPWDYFAALLGVPLYRAFDKRSLMNDLKFSPEDFERLRRTLAAHLEEIMPEREEREKHYPAFFKLISDLKAVAVDCADAALKKRLENAIPLYAFCGGFHPPNEAVWFPESAVTMNRQGRLVCIEAYKKVLNDGESE